MKSVITHLKIKTILAFCGLTLVVSHALADTITLNFNSPATNSAAGATFNGSFTYTPDTNNVTFSILSGSSLLDMGGSGMTAADGSGSVVLKPATNKSGEVTAQLKLTPGATTKDFKIWFRRYAPQCTVADQTMLEDAVLNVSVAFSYPDRSFPDGSFTVSAASSNTALVDNNGLVFSGTGATRTLKITPKANQNGTATITVTFSDANYHNVQKSFVLTVTPVNDAPVVSNVNDLTISDNVGSAVLLPDIQVVDVDDQMPSSEYLTATITLNSDVYVTFENGDMVSSISAKRPGDLTTALRALRVYPKPFTAAPGVQQNIPFDLSVSDGTAAPVIKSATLHLDVVNTAPDFRIMLNPTAIIEGQSHQLFNIDYIYDPDLGDETFQLRLAFDNPAQAYLGHFMPTNILTGNQPVLRSEIRNIVFQATPGAVTNDHQEVAFRFTLTDSYGGTQTNRAAITIYPQSLPPTISGIPNSVISCNDGDAPFAIFPTVVVIDNDLGGQQQVRAELALSDATLGTLSATTITFRTPAQLQSALRAVTFAPAQDVKPINSTFTTFVTLRVIDDTALAAENNNLSISVKSVNNAPRILNVPPLALQPVVFAPDAPLRPFAEIGLTNDDTNSVIFTIAIDNISKGTFTTLGAFESIGGGAYRMTGSLNDTLSSLTNIVFELNETYPFPQDDPGGTLFTLTAQDATLLTTSKNLYIQVQNEPRNHLVTRTVNDGLPGSFAYALEHLGNYDFITFALPEYPAVVRMPGATPVTLQREITIQGPGANLLTISGDSDGDNTPDHQLFKVKARVTIAGVTLAHGSAALGGAVAVESAGHLILKQVAIIDCQAQSYGGAIDVDGGELTVDSCYIGNNSVLAGSGLGGGAISAYTHGTIHIVNTTFAGNLQPNQDGDGGGAIIAECATQGLLLNLTIENCTFADNIDLSGRASAVLGIGPGAWIKPLNTIFSSTSEPNVNVAALAQFESRGGNICQDSSRATLLQGGGEDVYLLDHLTDLIDTDPQLDNLFTAGNPLPYYPLKTGSPAIERGGASTIAVDQRGALRGAIPDVGAIEFGEARRIVINEIMTGAGALNFVELYVPRDSAALDLTGYTLFVNGTPVHHFAAGRIVGTNDIYQFNVAAPTVVAPGFGYIVAFTNAPNALTTAHNLAPVVGASVGSVTTLAPRGSVMVGRDHGAERAPDVIVEQSWLAAYLDPVDGINPLDLTGQSLSLQPQYQGCALVPHGCVASGPFGGAHFPPDGALQTPGADANGTIFGQANSAPIAFSDTISVSADRVSQLDLLANDYDSDGNDRLSIVDVSTASDANTGDLPNTTTTQDALVAIDPATTPLRGTHVLYDPTDATTLRHLPGGVELIDTFYYEVIDIGAALVTALSSGGADTLVTSAHHRLADGDEVIISGSSRPAYNGRFTITLVDADHFAIPVGYSGPSATPIRWESVAPRTPTSRSEALVNIRVMGVNDPPTATDDVITNITESGMVRIMTRPELAGTALSFVGDPQPAPTISTQNILANDDDVDADDTWQNLRVTGLLNAINPIVDYSGTLGESPTLVTAPAHGLANGQTILLANYGGSVAYNGYHLISVVDHDHFTIPVAYIDNHPAKGLWCILTEENRHHTTTDVGAEVTLISRADVLEDHIIYHAGASTYLRGLAAGELYTNRFWYAVADSHGAIGIGAVDAVVVGENNPPLAQSNPPLLETLALGTNTLEQIMSEQLAVLLALPGEPERMNAYVVDHSGANAGVLQLSGLFVTYENQPLTISTTTLLANATDIDRIDVLSIASVDALSYLNAHVALDSGTQIIYNPVGTYPLTTLARGELRLDSFAVTVADGHGGAALSRVGVLVIGVNSPLVANDDFVATNEDAAILIDPLVNDLDDDIDGTPPDDRIILLPQSDVANIGNAHVAITTSNIVHDARLSEILNQLADWQHFDNYVTYTVTGNSHLFAVDDNFHVLADSAAQPLDVLANDHNASGVGGTIHIASYDGDAHLTLGTVSLAADSLALDYQPPAAFVGLDIIRYTIENELGDQRSATVLVNVVPPLMDGLLTLADDHYSVAAGETLVMDVLSNDPQIQASGSGYTLLGVVATDQVGQPQQVGDGFVYTATNGLAAFNFTYAVQGPGGVVATAHVTVDIVDRSNQLPAADDNFSVLPDSFDNELFVLANDTLIGEELAGLRVTTITLPAQHGTLSIAPGNTALLYTPTAGFIGVDEATYTVKDGLGATGSATIRINVGNVRAVPHFYKLLATDSSARELDVLATDRTLPAQRGTLRIVDTTFVSGDATIGTLTLNGTGDRLEFSAAGPLGQAVWNYTLNDASLGAPRSATGTVTIVTVGNGTYANPDTYNVRANGSDYELDVLANDCGFPSAGRTYSVITVGAPDAGGSVSIVGRKLRYTPAPEFTGVERFTYTMSDAFGTDVAQVTVNVRPGELVANHDRFTVYYEWDQQANAPRAMTLPVTLNDALQPAFDKNFALTGIGIGVNAPDHGATVTLAASLQELIYRPSLEAVAPYSERFTYEIGDESGRRAVATVLVQVVERTAALDAVTQDDNFNVARNSANNLLDLLANDNVRPANAANWQITALPVATLHGGNVTPFGRFVRYTPAAGFVGVDTFTYGVNDGLGGTGGATVHVRVGNLPTRPDHYEVAHDSGTNRFDVVANDPLTQAYANAYRITSVTAPDAGGSAWQSIDNAILYTPNPAYSGTYPYTESFTYTLKDDSATPFSERVTVTVHDATLDRATATVHIQVQGLNDPPEIANTTVNAPITDKQSTTPFGGVTLIEHDEQTLEPLNVTVAIDAAEKGVLTNLGGFTALSGGSYLLTNVTAAVGTSQLRQLRYVPVENRISVPDSEQVTFTIIVTDNKSTPVVDSTTTLSVAPVNDPPQLAGTEAAQNFYYKLPVNPFSHVLVTEVDDLTLQPLTVTITVGEPTQGVMQNLGSFTDLGSGIYRATNITAEAATAQLKAIEFKAADTPPATTGILTHLALTIDDGFADPVLTDNITTVIAVVGYEQGYIENSADLNGNFALAVATISDYALVGAPNAATNGAGAGVVFVYHYESLGVTGRWTRTQMLQPASVSAGHHFGRALSMISTFAAIGAPDQTVSGVAKGSVYLYRRNMADPAPWSELMRITPTNVTNAAKFGAAVALSGDLLAVGAPNATLTGAQANSGAVFLFGRNVGGANAWGEIMRWAPTNGMVAVTEFAYSVALHGDTLIVGAPDYDANPSRSGREGGVFHFAKDAGGADQWGLRQVITAVDATQNGQFGWSVAVDESRLAVGAPSMTMGGVANAGSIYLYAHNLAMDEFNYLTSLSRHTDQELKLGYTLALDGGRLFAGAPENNTSPNQGAAYLFEGSTTSNSAWRLVEKFKRPTGSNAELFGRSVAFHQGSAVVGATLSAIGGTQSLKNAAYFYRFEHTPLQENFPLPPRQLWDTQHFGAAINNPNLEDDLWGDHADPDGDGIANAVEYVFGGDPLIAETSVGRLSIAMNADGNCVIDYNRRSNDPALQFTLEASHDLITWEAANTLILDEIITPLTAEVEHVTLIIAHLPENPLLLFKIRAH